VGEGTKLTTLGYDMPVESVLVFLSFENIDFGSTTALEDAVAFGAWVVGAGT
jgi:hypothetical protein